MAEERDDVATEALLDVHAARSLDQAQNVGRVGDGGQRFERRLTRLLVEHARFLGERRVPERQPHREAVELCLRQRVRPLVLDRVLRRHDHERRLERIRDSVHRHLPLLHAFEQRRLRLRRGAVDLVDEEEIREDRPGPELELVPLLVEDVDARDVGRQQVRRELETRKLAVQRACERLGEHRLPDARKVLDDRVPLGDEAEDDEAQRLLRCVDHAAEVLDDRRDLIAWRLCDRALSHPRAAPPPRRGLLRRSRPSAPSRPYAPRRL